MTHKDIFTKFMIEYDKANVTSSYPSLTEYEIATVLDKAYMALIALKVTGNNVRRSPLEADVKSVADLQPLVTTKMLYFDQGDSSITFDDLMYDGNDGSSRTSTTIEVTDKKSRNTMPPGKKGSYTYEDQSGNTVLAWLYDYRNRSIPDNVRSTKLPEDMLYFVSAVTAVDVLKMAGIMNDVSFKDDDGNDDIEKLIRPMDNKQADYDNGKVKRYRAVPVQLTSHQIAQKFFATAYNIPWVKTPMCYIEGNYIYVVADPIVGLAEIAFEKHDDQDHDVPSASGKFAERLSLTYIKMPNKFVIDQDLLDENDSFSEPAKTATDAHKALWNFELNDVAAEELISLAISYALENVESPRLNAHLGMRGLES